MVDVVLKRVYNKGHICFELPNDAFILEHKRRILRRYINDKERFY